jgi:hypothetical protein
MVTVLAFLAAGLLPPSNGVRRVEPDPIAEIRRQVPAKPVLVREPCPEPLKRPAGWIVASRVTPKERRWADRVLTANRGRVGAKAFRNVAGRPLLARIEWHWWPERGWHKGTTLYVRGSR